MNVTSSSELRTPPHSIEAEQSLLGGLLLDEDAWDRIADVVSESDFYRQDHGQIFAAIRGLRDGNTPCDVVTLAEWLTQHDKLDQVGGLNYLAELVEATPSAANIVSYARIVRERAVARRLIHAGSQISDAGFQPEGRPVVELLDYAEGLVFAIAEETVQRGGGVRSIQDVLAGTLDRLDELSKSDNPITGLASGFSDLDRLTSGLQAGELVVVAGRPSMGKTAFAMNLAENCAIRLREPVAIFSMEMPAEQLVLRLIASLGRVDSQLVRNGKLADEDWHRIGSVVSLLNDAPVFIDDTPALTAGELRARARRIKRQHGLGMIVVDYLQLMRAPAVTESRTAEISEISRSLKALAKELSVPVIALSQLNRALEQRPDKRPKMADLRESGAIEQDADLIAFIYRDEVYNEDTADKGTAEIIVAKQRNGPIGTVRLAFLGTYTRFEDLAVGSY